MKIFKNIVVLALAIAMLLTTVESFTKKISAAETKTSTEYFAYRVDVLDAGKGYTENIAVQVLSSIDGRVYVYVNCAGEEKPTAKTVMDSGNSVYVTAGEENELYGLIKSSKSIKVGEKYDIYIVFEDPAHVAYGPYVVKKWTAKYFPSGNGTKKKPYQIWTPRHLYNVSKFMGDSNEGKYFKVMQDIDLSESIYSGRIGSYASAFYGVFDGNGKTIRGLLGNMFAKLAPAAAVRNVYLAGADSTLASTGISGLIAEANNGIIEKCVVYNSEIGCSTYQGIICGVNHESGIIRNCATVDCIIYANDCAGGIVGRNEGKVENCYSNITMKSNSTAGGIVGANFGGGVSDCLGNITVIPKSDTPNSTQNIGGIVGVNTGSSAYICNCTSLFLPEDLYDLGDVGSIWGSRNGGGDNINLENIVDNVGAVKYTIEDIKLTDKEVDSSKNEEYLAKKLEEKRSSFVSHHGASSDTRDVVNPVKKLIAGGNPDGKNKAELPKLNIKYKHVFENETKAYNAKKKFPMTQKTLKVKGYSTPDQVKIKNVSIDSENRQVTITWNTVKKADGYEIYRAEWEYARKGGKYGTYEREKTIESADITEYTDKYLAQKNKYYYRVRAYYKVNNVKIYGPFSDIEEVKFVND